ncbi:D-amino acid dehydrogenase [Aminobacter sp. MDW-2]|uniref:D-amino acid dehydrogenase n=1 Tax=Aminobacter sp. MDW-2 TaxID=2666139 RepID=UPI0012AF7BDE|nr:D-amino acid dehydrogenase [Aminobacter sp. MDW-2]MRX35250.1 FAD-dependent oxidoreductase [Aminobacter sp. MDW-2]QNH35719.1 D-amino acid dehydrogenase [Aminobacter sp. MDW-2]
MKVIVVGGGVIGVTTAYYLAEAGHEVVVYDRQKGPAQEASYANSGEIASGCASPLATPGLPLKALKWLAMKDDSFSFRPKFDPKMWMWLARVLRNCTAERYQANKSLMVPLAEYSRDMLRVLREGTGIAYDELSHGTLQLFRTQEQLDGIAADVAVLDRLEVPYEILDAAGCVEVEPGLVRSRHSLSGGLRLPDDETGDCSLFTERLVELCAARGVVFKFGQKVFSIDAWAGKVQRVTVNGHEDADAFVLAAGSYSERFMRKLHQRLPLYPLKGYSLTVPIADVDAAPASSVIDVAGTVAVTRLGDRIRIGGTVEISGFDLTLHEQRRVPLERALSELFPDAGDLREGRFWCGLRSMTPDGPPVLGRTKLPNLYVNAGHGMLGWTMACGSAKILADMISGREPEIDISGLGPERFWA